MPVSADMIKSNSELNRDRPNGSHLVDSCKLLLHPWKHLATRARFVFDLLMSPSTTPASVDKPDSRYVKYN